MIAFHGLIETVATGSQGKSANSRRGALQFSSSPSYPVGITSRGHGFDPSTAHSSELPGLASVSRHTHPRSVQGLRGPVLYRRYFGGAIEALSTPRGACRARCRPAARAGVLPLRLSHRHALLPRAPSGTPSGSPHLAHCPAVSMRSSTSSRPSSCPNGVNAVTRAPSSARYVAVPANPPSRSVPRHIK